MRFLPFSSSVDQTSLRPQAVVLHDDRAGFVPLVLTDVRIPETTHDIHFCLRSSTFFSSLLVSSVHSFRDASLQRSVAMDGFALALEARGANNSFSSNSTRAFHHLINQLMLDNSIQSRTSTMLTAGFNIGAALIIAVSIIYDAWRNEKKRQTIRPK